MSGALSPTHWVIIIAVFALLFGARKLPEAARGMGQAMRIFKAETSELHSDRRDGDRRAVGESGSAATPSSAATPGMTQPTSYDPAQPTTSPPAAPPQTQDQPRTD
ncbi:MAG: Sec-independent protein translocase subunit TatA [Pseudonocardiaceae bacterium]